MQHEPRRLLKNVEPETRGRSTHLVVAVHAWRASSAALADVAVAIKEALPDADLLIPDYPAGLLSQTDPVEIAEALGKCIADAVVERKERGGAYEGIILIGHSLGALLIRKAYVFAKGQNQDHSGHLRPAPQPWGDLVSRIILMAGINRGWDLHQKKANELPWFKWCGFVMAAQLWRWFRLGRLINGAHQGAPFVANLRIQWMRLARNASLSPPVPTTVQMLGTIDDIVDEADNVDVLCGANFVYKEVPDTGHVNVLDFSGDIGRKRKHIFLDALCTEKENLTSDRTLKLKSEPLVEHVVFIMHGIRDLGHWTNDLAQVIAENAGRKGVDVRAVTSGYGYFPMIGFLLQPERQRNVRWFMDQYTEALARYPNAKLSFIGHSNGSYLLASALERYEACAFERAVFAGSVVNRNFPWGKFVDDGRISAVQNYVATADWVVAIFPALFERFQKKKADLGSAGHTGFASRDPPVYEVIFINGGHSAAIVSENFDALAHFILGDNAARPATTLLAKDQRPVVVWAGKFCTPIWAVLLAFVLTPLWAVPIAWHFGFVSWLNSGWSWAVVTAIWIVSIYAILRRV